MIERTHKRPDPAEFDDYRDYLRQMVAFLKATGRGFSYRSFARRAGYSTPSFLKHVLDGERNLATDSIEKFAKGLGLDPREKRDFHALVLLSQAKTDAERNYYYRRLRRNRPSEDQRAQIEKAHYEAYSMWWAFPIREMMWLSDFKEDPSWISKRIYPPVKAADVERALEVLEHCGLIARDGKGRLRPVHNTLQTPEMVRSLAVRNFHRAMLGHAVNGLEALPQEERSVTSVTLALTRPQYEELCRRISEFQDEVLDWPRPVEEELYSREVYSVGFHVVPLTRKESKK